jgi:hypothetical protein
MEDTAHHLLGINPMSFSYVSGHGENSVMNIYSAIFSEDKRLDPYQIPPGYFTEGTNHYDNRHLSKFDGKCYLDSDAEYTTNENTIYGNAAMTFLLTAVMNYTVTAPHYGDVDGDGKIDSADVTLLRRYIAAEDKKVFLGMNTGFREDNAKVTGRDTITAADVTMLRRWIASGDKFDLGPQSSG